MIDTSPSLPDLKWLRENAADLDEVESRNAIVLLIAALEEARADYMQGEAAFERLTFNAAMMSAALREISEGCGMLNQPAAMNGPEEEWLKRRITEYERRAYNALAVLDGKTGS